MPAVTAAATSPAAASSAATRAARLVVGLSDASLLDLIASRTSASPAAYAELHRRHHAWLAARVAARQRAGACRNDVDDVVQETLLSVWRRAAQYDPSRGSVRAWMSGIAARACVDLYRRSRRRLGPLTVETVAEPGRDVDGSERSARGSSAEDRVDDRLVVTTALARLSDAQRHVILHAYDDGLSQTEIADVLSVPLGTVKTRTFAALAVMRRHLATAN